MNKSLQSSFIRLRTLTLTRQQVRPKAALVARSFAPIGVSMLISGIAHAQGTIDMSGAKTVVTTFQTFAMYAGAVVCLGGLPHSS